MFHPPFCPNRHCSAHKQPSPNHYRHHGSYHPKCRPRPVPRFRCKSCQLTYSRQTFRADYRDHKPHLNARLFELLVSGVGLRQSSRLISLTLRCTELKFRKLAFHLQTVNLTQQGPFKGPVKLQLDEIETYEARRRERPVTLPILIETNSRFIIWAESGPLTPRGRMNDARRQAIAEDAEKNGIREEGSRTAVLRTLQRAVPTLLGHEEVVVQTDEKTTYPGLLRSVFGAERVIHGTTSSKRERTFQNPLFPINQTEAIARDLMGRLRRNSWLVSKKRRYLDLAFQMLMAWKNLARPRFNRDTKSPAMLAGMAPRRYGVGELLGWRQEWGKGRLPIGATFRSPLARVAG